MVQAGAFHRVVLGDEKDELIPVDAAEDHAATVLGHGRHLFEAEHFVEERADLVPAGLAEQISMLPETEGIKPAIDCVLTFGAGHFYISQSDKGGLVFGGDLDGYNTYAQRGNLSAVEDIIEGGVALWPGLGRLRLLRHWGGLIDMTMDGSPIIDRTPIDGLYLNGGWNYGGFKATPASGWCFAHLIAREEPHALNAAFRLDRFAAGAVIDEKGQGAQPNLH